MITKFETYIRESLEPDNRKDFYALLNILDEMEFTFIKSGTYLNTGNYLYFFRTEWIKNSMDVMTKLVSVKNTSDTYNKISIEKLCFYFGIRNGVLEFGLYNDFKDVVYKTGEFSITDGILKQMKSFKCLVLIGGILRNSSIKNLMLLHQIKKDLKGLFEDRKSKGIHILTTSRLRKKISKELLLDEVKNDKLIEFFVNWCSKFPWNKKVESYVDDTEDDVSFYIKLKPKVDVQL